MIRAFVFRVWSGSRKSYSTSSALFQYPEILARLRSPNELGSKKSRELRKKGEIPGVVYGVDEDKNVLKFSVSTELKPFLKELRLKGASIENTIYNLVLDNGTKNLVTPRQIQLHPLSDQPISVNFLRYWPGNTMRIPFKFINQDLSIDIRRGCFLVHVNNYVDCICENEIPSFIHVDVAGVKHKDVIRLSSIVLPPGVRPIRSVSSDAVICVVQSS